MDVLDGVQKQVLGVKIQTRTQIILTFLIPAWLELTAYLLQTLTDIALSAQYFRKDTDLYGGLTIAFTILPSVVCFTTIMASASQWPQTEGWGWENVKFLLLQFFNLVLFPVGAVYRFSRRIFWSMESLFHEDDTYEKEASLRKAGETSPFELYHFMQAYLQAAPQIILQVYAMLNENIFRDYETTHLQIMSIVFSSVNVAVITMSFQRFESQKNVGRHYPWAPQEVIQRRVLKFRKRKILTEQIRENKKKGSQILNTFPESEHIYRKFKKSFSDNDNETRQSHGPNDEHLPVFDDEPQTNLLRNATDDDKLTNLPDEADLRRNGRRVQIEDLDAIEPYEEPVERIRIESMKFDSMPDVPAPPPPISHDKMAGGHRRLSRLLLSAETYICDNIPHPPQFLIDRTQKKDIKIYNENRFDVGKPTNPERTTTTRWSSMEPPRHPECPIRTFTATSPSDEVDFYPPTRRTTIKGIEQDEFIGKLVSFLGWIMFIFMRLLSLSVFLHFYQREFIYGTSVHYLLMLCALINETRFQEKLHRLFFYVFLAYIYVYVVIEFKIEFKHVRCWYIGYVLFVLAENLAMTIIWYNYVEDYSWWYEFIYSLILGSGFLSLTSMLFYYFLLRPKDVILFEN